MIEILLLVFGSFAVARKMKSAGLAATMHVAQYVLVFILCELFGVIIGGQLDMAPVPNAFFSLALGAIGGFLCYRYSAQIADRCRMPEEDPVQAPQLPEKPDERENNEENQKNNE